MRKIEWICCLVFCLACWTVEASSKNPVKRFIIQGIPPEGIVISQPGKYVFGNNITWNPVASGAAITVLSSGVILNLRGYTLQSVPSPFKTTGISAVGCVDLKIKNGTIKNLGLAGIQCTACANILIKDIVVNGLNTNDTTTYTVPTGILTTFCYSVAIDRCTVKNIKVKTGSCAGIQLSETFLSKISNCRVANMLNLDGACTGIGHLLCDGATVQSCQVKGLQSQFIDNLNTEGHTAIGIIPVASTNLNIQGCTVSDIIGCCDDAHGMSVFLCSYAVVNRCKVSNVLDGAGPALTGAKATGIEVYGSHVQVRNCHVKKIRAINPQDKQATGFSCSDGFDIEFYRCKAEEVSVVDGAGNQNPSLGYGTGFGWAPDPRPSLTVPVKDVLYLYCTAENCQVGFDSWFHIDSTWDHIVSKCNQIAVLNQNDTAQRTLSCDPCSECGCQEVGCYPTPLVVTLTNVAANNTFVNVEEKKCK